MMKQDAIFNIEHSHIVELYKQGFTLDVMFYLEQLDEGVDIRKIDEYRVKGLCITMERKNLMRDGVITPKGKELLEFVRGKGEQIKFTKPKQDEFDKWWETYPATNMFEFNGVTMPGVQAKRQKKDLCRAKFNSFVVGGEFTAEEIIGATAFHFKVAMEQSVKKKTNELTYIPNSERYLREKSFAPYIKLYKKGNTGNDENVKRIVNTKDLF